MANPNLQKIIKLTQSQYNTLANGGTVGDYTGLNDNYLYLIQEDYEFPTTTTARKILMSTSIAGLVSWQSLTANDIPSLDASKINSGIFNASRIPNLNASKITGGTFDIARIPTGTTASTVALGNHNHDSVYLGINATAADSSKLGSQAASYYAPKGWVSDNYLGISAKAADSNKLNGQLASYYATATHTHTAANIISWLGLGTIRSASSMTWGTLTTANGYTILLATDQPNGGGWVIAEKDGKTYMQIDGDFYVNEGGTRLARVGEAQPASDVYAWAKASTKPSYTYSEVGAAAASHTHTKSQITDFPSSMPANGGTSDYTNYLNITSTRLGNGSNKLQFMQYSGATDNPSNDWYSHIIMHHANNNGYYTEIATHFHGDNVYFRRKTNGTVGEWKRLAFAGESQPASDVYAWAKASTKPSYTYSEVGAAASNHNHDSVYLGINATAADSSKLNGQAASYYLNYNNFTNTPTIPTESTVSGWGFTKNIGTVTQVKIGTTPYNPTSGVISLPAYPTTLPASDVYSWAKQANKPTYTASEVGALASDAKVVLYTSQSLTTLQKSIARSNIGAGTSSLALGNTATTAAAGNHNHDSVYLKLTGGTITGGLSVTQGISVGGGIIPYFPQSTTNFLYGYGGCYTQNVHQQVDVIGDIIALYTSDESRDYSTVLAVHNEGYGIALKAHFAYTSNHQAAVYDRDSFNAAVLTIYAEDLLIYPSSVNSSLTNKFVHIGVVEHNVKITYSTTFYVRLNFRGDNSVETAATNTSTLAAKLYSAGHRSAATALCCSGRYTNYQYCVTAIYALSTTTLRVVYLGTTNITESEYNIPSSATVTDVLTYKLVA